MSIDVITRTGLEFSIDGRALDAALAFARDIKSDRCRNFDAVVLFSGIDETGRQVLGFGVLPRADVIELDSFQSGGQQFFLVLSDQVANQLKGKCLIKGDKGFEIA
jgi:hypothetical protein